MVSRNTYAPDVKAQAIAALVAGESSKSVSQKFGIPDATVRGWRSEAKQASNIVQHEKKVELGELVANYLTEVLTTLQAQSVHARNPDWLQRQNASDLAILHGVLTDKAIRLLAALQPVNDHDGNERA